MFLWVGGLPLLAHAKSKPRNGLVQINGSVPGAQVRVDGADMGTTPLRNPISVRPGTHLIEVQKYGVGTMSQKVTVVAGATVTVVARLESDEPPLVALEPLPTAPPVPAVSLLPSGLPMIAPPWVAGTLPAAATGSEIPLQAQSTLEMGPAWYDHWWVWAAAGVVVAGAGVLTYELVKARNQPDLTIVVAPAHAAGVHF